MSKSTISNALIALAATFTLAACGPDATNADGSTDSNANAGAGANANTGSNMNTGSNSSPAGSSARNARALPAGSDVKIDAPGSSTRVSALVPDALDGDVVSVAFSGVGAYAGHVNALVDSAFAHIDRARDMEPALDAGGVTTWNVEHAGVSTQLVVEELEGERYSISLTETGGGVLAVSGTVELDAAGDHVAYDLSLAAVSEAGDQVALTITMAHNGEFRLLEYDFAQTQGSSALVESTRYWDVGVEGMIEHDIVSTGADTRVGTVQVRWGADGGRVDAVETGSLDLSGLGASEIFTTSCWGPSGLVVFDGVYAEAALSDYALARGEVSDCAVDLASDLLYGEDLELPEWEDALEDADEFEDYDEFSTPYGDVLFD